MNDTVAARVAWRRRQALHSYLGTLATTDAGFRLDGREPATGIELSLSIPFSEIEAIRVSNGSVEPYIAEPAAVFLLSASEPVLVREVGREARQAPELVLALTRLLEQARRGDEPREAA